MFDQFDKDKSGFLDAVEVMQMVSEWRVAPSVVHFIMQSMETGGGSVNFDTFYRQVCSMCFSGMCLCSAYYIMRCIND